MRCPSTFRYRGQVYACERPIGGKHHQRHEYLRVVAGAEILLRWREVLEEGPTLRLCTRCREAGHNVRRCPWGRWKEPRGTGAMVS